MRTTLDIDHDVLLAAKEIGRRTRCSIGKVVSDLARRSLTSRSPSRVKEGGATYGFRPLPREPGKIVTNEMIDRLCEDEGS